MKALSILQPWAWLIVTGHKDIENRSWFTPYRGRFLVHAGKKYGPRIHAEQAEYIRLLSGITLPPYEHLKEMTGGFVGWATITDCVRQHRSIWKNEGTWGFVLKDALPLPFKPWRGELGFFEVPE